MRILFSSFLFIILPHLLVAQSTIDTVNIDINEIIVIGYETNRNILETPVSVATVNPETVNKLDASSLLFGMNSIAGVVMEERATGSYRLAIRGSSLRSPYGIRNVKVYWNGIPYTEPSGSTFLNLLDVSNMQSLEIIKGPAGSLFGAGNGGVIHIESTPTFLHDQITSSFSVGSFGSWSTRLSAHNHFNNGLLSFKYATQTTDGYRDQSFLDRHVFEITGTTEYIKDRELSASVLYSELNYGIPGGLNADQFASDPTQARPGNPFALGSVDANASIIQEALIFGITHDATVNNRWVNSSSIFGTFSDFQNPFIFDYKIDSRKSGGFRSVFKHNLNIGKQHAEINFGTEYQASSYSSRNFKNDTSKIGSLNFDDLLKVQHLTSFASLTLDLKHGWIISSGLSFNLVGYEINRLFTAQDNDVTGKVGIDFDPQVIPRLSIAKNLNDRMIMFSGFGYGFSPPTIEEIRTNEGSINQDLQPEIGFNIEYGIRGYAFKGRWGFDFTTFYYRLKDSIVQQQSDRGTTLFRNAGSTNQLGVEINSDLILVDHPKSFIKRLEWNVAYTLNHFKFDSYLTNDGDFSGNDLTGVAPHIVLNMISISERDGFYATLSHRFNDKIPLEDDNSVYSEAYHLVQTKLGWKGTILYNLDANFGFGIDNLLNETYSRGFDINAFGGRYFQPAPERNWFLTFSINYKLGH